MILIANIGNSNLNYQGLKLEQANFPADQYPAFYVNGRFNFREATRFIEADENYPKLQQDLTEVILSTLLPAKDVTIEVVLITTDQPDPNYQHSDTCYEGLILQRLLPALHPQIKTVRLVNFKGTPVREEEIHQKLLPELRVLVQELPTDQTIRYSESGGTPQLKTAVKELLRDLLPSKRFDPHYTPFGQEAHSTSNPYGEKRVLLRAARQFINESYDYAAAGRLLDQMDKQVAVGQQLRELIRAAEYRREFRGGEAASLLNDLFPADGTGKRNLPTSFLSLLPENWPTALGQISDIKDAEDRFNITEIAHLCQFYFKQKNYSLGIPAYVRLCEEIGQCYANTKGFSTKDRKKTTRFLTNTKDAVQVKFPNLGAQSGVPYLLAYASLTPSAELKRLIDELILTISHVNGTDYKGFNELRNRCFLAHGTNGISEDAVKGEDKKFLTPGTGRAARIFRLLGLPDAKNNIYDQMNAEILALFAQE